MATHHQTSKGTRLLIDGKKAIGSLVFALAGMVQLLETDIHIGALNYTLPTEHSAILSIAALVFVYGFSDTKDLHEYAGWEKALVVITVALLLAAAYVGAAGELLSNQSPQAGIVAFIITVAGWAVVAR